MNAAASFLALFIVALGYGVIVPLGPTLVREAMGPIAAQAISFHTGALSAACKPMGSPKPDGILR